MPNKSMISLVKKSKPWIPKIKYFNLPFKVQKRALINKGPFKIRF